MIPRPNFVFRCAVLPCNLHFLPSVVLLSLVVLYELFELKPMGIIWAPSTLCVCVCMASRVNAEQWPYVENARGLRKCDQYTSGEMNREKKRSTIFSFTQFMAKYGLAKESKDE